MSFTDEYLALQKKKKKKETEQKTTTKSTGHSFTDEYFAQQSTTKAKEDIAPLFVNKTASLYSSENIAPVAKAKAKATVQEEKDERKWFQKGEFEDGYQFGDIARTIMGTSDDLTENLLTGVLGMGEKIVDAGAYVVGGVGGLFGADEFKEKTAGFIKKDLYNEENIAKKIIGSTLQAKFNERIGGNSEESSVFGEKSDALVQSAGQLAGTIGLQMVGVPWFVTSGVVGFGSEAENALNQGATYGKAGASAAIAAGAEILTEKLFGGSGLGETGLIAVDSLTKGISSKVVKALADYGIDVLAEGSEEVISEFFSNLGSSLYREEKMGDILFSEEAIDAYIESFIGGGVLGGVMNASNAVSSVRTGRDYRSGLSVNEQKVFDKEVESRIAEQEKGGKKLTNKEKAVIEEAVVRDMEKGYISTDTIEEVLGGESYSTYKRTVESEDALQKEFTELNRMKQSDMTGEQLDRRNELKAQLEDIKQNSKRDMYKSNLSENVFGMVKGDRLAESYNERARRGQAFEADLTKYDAKQQKTIQKAVESGILNNSNRTHEFVDMIAKISADKGVLFDFTNNERLKESGFAVDGDAQVNGYVTKDGITLNMDSAKARNSVVGHEITHVLEGTELYTELQSAIVEYAKSKGDYQARYDSLSKLYQNVEGADVNAELTADLVGDYLFTDADFVRNLSVQHKNVFQKIYDEIKYLCKVATAGSKEARELEKVKRAFEKAYQESGKTEGTKYSVSDKNIKDISTGYGYGETYYTMSYTQDGKTVATLEYGEYDGEPNVKMIEVEPEYRRQGIARKLLQELQKKYPDAEINFGMTTPDGTKLLESITYDVTDEAVVADRQKLKALQTELNELQEQLDILYDTDNLTEEQYAELHRLGDRWQEVYETIHELSESLRGKTATKTYVKYSLSDSDGKQLSKEQRSDGDFKVMDDGSVTKYSLSTWTPETQTKVRSNLLKAGYEGERVDKWIKDVNSVASVIAADKDRLDFEAADNQTMLKNNEEYVKTLDASTLCAKRLLYQGTFDAIQHRMPNTMLSSDDLIDLLNMMKEHKVQTPCGVCYVESRRRHLGKFAQEWLDKYDGEYKPNLDEVTTSDGLEALRKSHPQAYEDFITAMNKKGSSNPKVVQLRTEYRNEIMSLTPAQIRKIEAIGGMRVQSFSDFETPHLLDMMQAVMDMSAKGLSSQAYTKVPNFAWVFGDTGIKINLSLIAEGNGFDSDGNLAFSSVEGMDIDEAMKLRDAYSENVGTIIVGANDKHILACMADDRIDYIIPFHRSGWGQKELNMMGMDGYTDYTYGQKEHSLETGKGVANLYPPDYWDYKLSGKENAERYLNLCAKTGREPKFSHFLVNNGDGSYSLQPDGSTDGYWKTLIDFKMYDNDGNGAAQQKVQPNFNMEEAYRVLNEYEGGANSLPVANDVVEEFVAKYQSKKSLSRADEEFAPTGSLRELKLEAAPVPNTDSNTQPVSNTDSNTVNALESVEEDIAPVAKSYMAESTPKYETIRPKPQKQPRMARATPAEQARAEILVDEPKVEQKKKNGLWNWAKVNLLDPGTVFETLSLKSGNPELQAKFSSIKRAESRAQRHMENGNGMSSSLKSIREGVEKTGKTKQFYEYLYHLHNKDRMSLENRYSDVENKPVFGSSITADISALEVAELEKRNPEFKRLAQEVYNYMGNLREMLVEGGVISRETAQLWQEMYPHYVPIRREGHDGVNINVPLDSRKTGINAPIKRATGGNSNILPLFDTMAQRTIQTYKAIAKNRFGVELKNTIGHTIESEAAGVDEVIDSIDTNEELLQAGKNGMSPTFTVFENGERVTFEITDEMYDAMKPKSGAATLNSKVLNTANNLRRGLITEYNPVFAVTNPIKDIQDVLINSKHPARTYANMPKAIAELMSNGHWYQEYLDNGGEQNTYFESETNTFTKEKSALRKVVGFPIDKLSQVNNFIEKVPRLAEYIASRNMGRSIDVSMLDAARVTTDFSAGGHITKMMNRNGFTFLNASVQGAVQQVRNVREAKYNGLKGWAQLAGKAVVAGLPAMLLNHLLWDDDEEYDELSDYVKQNYYIVGKFGDGKFVRIPKGRTVAVIQNAIEQMENLITGNDEVDLGAFTELVISNLAPSNPLDNNIIAPIAQAWRNETWYGEDLVPTRLADLPAAEQYDESTDSISRWLGEKTPFSPYKINYVLDQYSGGIGDTFLPMLTPEAESGNNTFVGNLLAPWKDKFTTDAVMNNQNVSDFYTKKDELMVNANATEATEEDVLMSKYLNSVNAEMSKLYAEKRKIQNSDLPDAEKYAAVRDVQKQIVELSKEGLDTYGDISFEDDYREGGEYARVNDRLYKLNDEGEWSKLSDDQVTKYEVTKAAGNASYATDGTNHYRWYVPGEDADKDTKPGWRKVTDKELEKQQEVTSGLGISPEKYWSNREEYSYAYEHPENYAVAKAVGGYDAYRNYSSELYDIKADKDSNGKSISGSRKEKVLDYVNGLDIDYGEKLILFKSEYNADDDYNYEIIDYLNSREDISYEEMATILKKLGFTVSANGDISW